MKTLTTVCVLTILTCVCFQYIYAGIRWTEDGNEEKQGVIGGNGGVVGNFHGGDYNYCRGFFYYRRYMWRRYCGYWHKRHRCCRWFPYHYDKIRSSDSYALADDDDEPQNTIFRPTGNGMLNMKSPILLNDDFMDPAAADDDDDML